MDELINSKYIHCMKKELNKKRIAFKVALLILSLYVWYIIYEGTTRGL